MKIRTSRTVQSPTKYSIKQDDWVGENESSDEISESYEENYDFKVAHWLEIAAERPDSREDNYSN